MRHKPTRARCVTAMVSGTQIGWLAANLIIAFVLAGCASGGDKHEAHHATPHWGYAGNEAPSHWADVSPDFQLCGSGKMQSPIDLAAANVSADVGIELAYQPLPLTVLNNGHTVQFNVANGSVMRSHGKTYTLMQVHFHTPSEHLLGGSAYPMEAHFVHKADDGSVAVIGLFYVVGKENVQLAGLIKHLPTTPTEPTTYTDVTMDPGAMLPAKPTLYRYMGSLTTPPCSEGVSWFVVSTPAEASAQQIALMTATLGVDARPVMPLNNRLLVEPR